VIIDFHAHIFPPEMTGDRGRFLDDDNFRLLYESPRSRIIDGDELVSVMDRTCVDRAVCMGFPWKIEKYRELQNGYLARAAGESGGRIIPFMSMPWCDAAGLAGEARALRGMGAAGIGEVAFYAGGFGKEREQYLTSLLEAAKAAGLPVCLHVNEPVGHHYAGKYEPELGRLFGVLASFPGHPVVLSHWGGGLLFYELMPEVRKALASAYYDTAASPYIYEDDIYSAARGIIGAERILFGTDCPLLEAGRYRPAIEKFFPGNEAGMVLGGNARRFLGL
jgi:hypothetical protein